MPSVYSLRMTGAGMVVRQLVVKCQQRPGETGSFHTSNRKVITGPGISRNRVRIREYLSSKADVRILRESYSSSGGSPGPGKKGHTGTLSEMTTGFLPPSI